MRRRISYLVGADEESTALHHASFSGNKVVIQDMRAAKHVRVRTQDTVLPKGCKNLTLTWAKPPLPGFSALGQPFNPPYQLGLRLDSSPGANWQAIRHWASAKLGVDVTDSTPIDAGEWYSWTNASPISPDVKWLGIDEEHISALRVSACEASNELIVEAWYPSRAWTEVVSGGTLKQEKVEVGVFAVSGSSDDRILSGRVREISRSKSDPIRFHTYPRYRPLSVGAADSGFVNPYGLHPTFQIDVNVEKPLEKCRLFAKLDLPPSVFMDKYQMRTEAESANNLTALGIWGETDLEAPVWAVNQGSSSLLYLHDPVATYRIPLHFRYQSPTPDLISNQALPAPLIFWACQDYSISEQDSPSTFGWSGAIGGIETVFPKSDTAFYIVETSDNPFRIPAIAPSHEIVAEKITSATLILGTVLILIAVFRRLKFIASNNHPSPALSPTSNAKEAQDNLAASKLVEKSVEKSNEKSSEKSSDLKQSIEKAPASSQVVCMTSSTSQSDDPERRPSRRGGRHKTSSSRS